MTEIDLYKQIVQKQDVFIRLLKTRWVSWSKEESLEYKKDESELASLRQQLEECDNIKFYSHCDSCGTLMVVKRSEIELLCMNPKCDNYIKQQMK